MNKQTVIIVVALLVAGFVGGYLLAPSSAGLGADPTNLSTVSNPWYFSNTSSPGGVRIASSTITALQIGSAGSVISELRATTCNLIGTDGSQAASSTAAYDCAVTGIASGDVVMAQLNRATAFGTNIGWTIHASKASTTAGYVTVILGNWSGVAAVPSVTAVGSTTQIWYMDN